MSSKSVVSAGSEFELGNLYKDRGDFIKATSHLVKSAELFLVDKKFDDYLECQHHLLRIYGEQEDFASINKTKEMLQDLVIQEGFELNAKTYYTLGVCASYKKQIEVAQDYFEKSLKLALKGDSKKDICYAIYGLAVVYWLCERFEDAIKEIYNLQVFFQIMPLPELKVSSLLLNGHILRDMKKYDQAIDIFWQAYESLKETKNLYMYVSLLFAMGVTYHESGELNLGKMYLQLAKKSIDPVNNKMLFSRIEARLKDIGDVSTIQYDLVLDSASNQLTERKKGKVDFKSQFILLDLLKLFMQHPGEVYSKEALVERVWRQNYDPSVHDNKVYVTIKRLRKMVEPDYDKPKYIFRSKNGYYLNKSTRVMVN